MNAVLRVITLILSLLIPFFVSANPVDSLRALLIAQKFYANRLPDLSASQKAALPFRLSQKRPLLNPKTDKTNTNFLYYIFNVGDSNGFVIVAGDDAAHPILGYSTTGYFETENQPSHVASWMQTYADQLQEIKDKRLTTTPEITKEWQDIRDELLQKSTVSPVVGPLLSTKWDQSPYYNDQCPYDGSRRSVTGCVATAMAQIMKYHNHPNRGSGFHEYKHQRLGWISADFNTGYDWGSMPNSLSWLSSSASKNSIAKLMYHCGVSLDMNYGANSSATPTYNVPYALASYFYYASSVQFVNKSSYSESAWKTLIRNELDNRRPIQYRGEGSGGGHSFVCDGYELFGLFHFNWGWGGSSDGYFSINQLNPGSIGTGGGTGGYNTGQGAVIGIAPRVNTAYNLQLYRPLQATYSNGNLSVSLNITNQGSSAFNGDYAVAVFDNESNFIDFVEIKQNYGNLPATSYYTNNITFSKNLFLWPGKFYLASYYREPNGQWNGIGAGSYSNWVEMNLSSTPRNLIEMYAPITVTPKPAFATQPLTVHADFANRGTNTFNGQFEVNLFKLDGSFVSTLITTGPTSLPAKYPHLII